MLSIQHVIAKLLTASLSHSSLYEPREARILGKRFSCAYAKYTNDDCSVEDDEDDDRLKRKRKRSQLVAILHSLRIRDRHKKPT